MPAKKPSSIPTELFDRYRTLIESQPGFELKGKAMPYTAINGNMSSFISPDGKLHIRLSKADKAAFMEQFNAAESVQHGVTMKEYVAVPDSVWNNPALLREYFGMSCNYAERLKAKT